LHFSIDVLDEEGNSASRILRPERVDVVHFREMAGEWQVSGIGAKVQALCREAFGLVFHGSVYLPGQTSSDLVISILEMVLAGVFELEASLEGIELLEFNQPFVLQPPDDDTGSDSNPLREPGDLGDGEGAQFDEVTIGFLWDQKIGGKGVGLVFLPLGRLVRGAFGRLDEDIALAVLEDVRRLVEEGEPEEVCSQYPAGGLAPWRAPSLASGRCVRASRRRDLRISGAVEGLEIGGVQGVHAARARLAGGNQVEIVIDGPSADAPLL